MTERDNTQRMGLPENTGEALPIEKPVEKAKDPFQFWNASTDFVELPSLGSYYDSPALATGKVEIKDMTAYHEDILSNRSYILEGVLFDKFIEAILVEDINPRDLLAGDRTAILLAARAAAYGIAYKSTVKCTACGSTNKVEAMLRKPTEDEPGNLRVNSGVFDKDIRELFAASYDKEARTIEFRLPESNIKVVSKLTDGHLEKSLFDYGAFKKKHGYGDLNNLDQMAKTIVALENVRDKTEIESLLKRMPASESAYWRSAYKALSPSIDIVLNQECSNTYCDNRLDQEVGLSPEFFWPKS